MLSYLKEQIFYLLEHSFYISIILFALFAAFILIYCRHACILSYKLIGINRKLKTLSKATKDDLTPYFGTDKVLAHSWKEYCDTLHPQTMVNGDGVAEVIATRATAPAEAFFGPALAESRVHADFFKHLPGLCTGLGIIGTFLGLIAGLQAFQVSDNPQEVRDSLGHLLKGVYGAFQVSATAIILAMLITFLEKILLALLNGRLEGLCVQIDRLFESGAGEEYLERLVKSSEEGTAQAKTLKDSLVGDLKRILEEITEKQIGFSQQHSREMIDRTDKLANVLVEPLTVIARNFETTNSSTSENISTALQDVLARFIERVETIFGGQIQGINDAQRETLAALKEVTQGFGELSESMRRNGQDATREMGEQMAQALQAMKENQDSINLSIRQFVDSLNDQIGRNQDTSEKRMESLMEAIGLKMSAMLEGIQKQQEAMALALEARESARSDAEAGRHQELAESHRKLLEDLAGMARANQETTGETLRTVREIAETVGRSTAEAGKAVDEAGQRAIEAMNSQMNLALERMGQQLEILAARQDERDRDRSAEEEARRQETAAAHRSLLDGFANVSSSNRAAAEETLRTVQGIAESVERTTAGAGQAMEDIGKRAIEAMAGQLGTVLSALEQRELEASQAREAREAAHLERTGEHIDGLTQSVHDAIQQLSAITQEATRKHTAAMQALVGYSQELKATTQTAIGRMNDGADRILSACETFKQSGEHLARSLDQANALSEKLLTAGLGVEHSARALETVFADYKRVRDGLETSIESLKWVVDNAKRESGLASGILERMEASAKLLTGAQKDADAYLEAVSRILADSQGQFQTGLLSVLREANQEIYGNLKNSVNLLAATIEEFEVALAQVDLGNG